MWKLTFYFYAVLCSEDFPGGSDGKASVYNAGDLGSIPGSGTSPGEENGNPLHLSSYRYLCDSSVSLKINLPANIARGG